MHVVCEIYLNHASTMQSSVFHEPLLCITSDYITAAIYASTEQHTFEQDSHADSLIIVFLLIQPQL